MGLTKSEGGRVATAKKQITDTFPEDGRDADTVTREIERRAARMRAAWGERVSLTPTAIAANWSQFDGPQYGAKKETGRPAVNVIAEPSGDWRAVAALLLLPVMPGEQWALLDRSWKVQILKALKSTEVTP
jgi:hypothetical protein